jgi:hypothetical protein
VGVSRTKALLWPTSVCRKILSPRYALSRRLDKQTIRVRESMPMNRYYMPLLPCEITELINMDQLEISIVILTKEWVFDFDKEHWETRARAARAAAEWRGTLSACLSARVAAWQLLCGVEVSECRRSVTSQQGPRAHTRVGHYRP